MKFDVNVEHFAGKDHLIFWGKLVRALPMSSQLKVRVLILNFDFGYIFMLYLG